MKFQQVLWARGLFHTTLKTLKVKHHFLAFQMPLFGVVNDNFFDKNATFRCVDNLTSLTRGKINCFFKQGYHRINLRSQLLRICSTSNHSCLTYTNLWANVAIALWENSTKTSFGKIRRFIRTPLLDILDVKLTQIKWWVLSCTLFLRSYLWHKFIVKVKLLLSRLSLQVKNLFYWRYRTVFHHPPSSAVCSCIYFCGLFFAGHFSAICLLIYCHYAVFLPLSYEYIFLEYLYKITIRNLKNHLLTA